MSFEILPYREAAKDVDKKSWIMFFDSGLERYFCNGQTAIALSSSPPPWPTPRLNSFTISALPVRTISALPVRTRKVRRYDQGVKFVVSQDLWEVQAKVLYNATFLPNAVWYSMFFSNIWSETKSKKRWEKLGAVVNKKLIESIGVVFGLEAFSVGDRVQQGDRDPFTISQIASHANGGALVYGNPGVAWWEYMLGYPQDLSLWSDRQRQFMQDKGVQINGI